MPLALKLEYSESLHTYAVAAGIDFKYAVSDDGSNKLSDRLKELLIESTRKSSVNLKNLLSAACKLASEHWQRIHPNCARNKLNIMAYYEAKRPAGIVPVSRLPCRSNDLPCEKTQPTKGLGQLPLAYN